MTEYSTIAQAGSFGELHAMLSENGGQLQHGDKVRFTMTLNSPIAPAFNTAGAELLFYDKMPPGLILDDVRGDGLYTVIVDAHATSPMFVAIGAWLVSEWWIIPLVALGIAVVLGAVITSIGFAVASVRSPAIIPQTAMWVGIGLAGLGLIWAISSASKKG